MKKIKFMAFFLSAALVFGSCGTMNNTAKGGIVGGGSGAALLATSVERRKRRKKTGTLFPQAIDE